MVSTQPQPCRALSYTASPASGRRGGNTNRFNGRSSGSGGRYGNTSRHRRSVQLNSRWNDDDDEADDDGANTPFIPPCSLAVSIPLSNNYERAVKRALGDPFVPYENTFGIINLAECGSSNGGGMGDGDDAPDMTPSELVDATLGAGGSALPGVRLVTWTILAVINWMCFMTAK
jgi:hypothetical protein